MSNSKFYLSLFVIFSSIFVQAQSTDPVVMKVNNTSITKSDFEYAYKKNVANGLNKQQSADEFLQSYINFKLNIEDAKKLGFDKRQSFISEYSKYLEQMESPYLTDSISPELVAKEIYKNLRENIEVSIIFTALPQGDILPKDTIIAYEKALRIRKLLTDSNLENFDELVLKNSEDSISRKSSTPGYIGWKTAFSYPYTFENVMYSTKVNTVSRPIRTNDGYTLVRVLNRKPDPGQVNVAHILIQYPQNPTPSEKDSVKTLSEKLYKDLIDGKDFAQLSNQYSADTEAAKAGGNMGWFGMRRPLPPVFESLIYSLKPSELSEPVAADYGYHIFKLIDKKTFPDWDSMKGSITKAIDESDRKELLIEKRIELLSQKYPNKLDQTTYKELQQAANQYHLSDTLFFKTIAAKKDKVLLHVSGKDYSIGDFMYYIERDPYTDHTLSTDALHFKTRAFVLDRLIEAQRINLFQEYPEFKHLMQEFHDGILYFDIMNQEVWEKAQADRSILRKLYEINPQKYTWDSPRYKGYVIHARNKDILKKAQALIKENKGADNLQQILAKALNTGSTSNIIVEKGVWAKGENGFVDRSIFKIKTDNEIIGYPEFMTEGRLVSSPENMNDVLGLVTAEYQNILEKERIDKLRSTYKVEIYEDVLQTIK